MIEAFISKCDMLLNKIFRINQLGRDEFLFYDYSFLFIKIDAKSYFYYYNMETNKLTYAYPKYEVDYSETFTLFSRGCSGVDYFRKGYGSTCKGEFWKIRSKSKRYVLRALHNLLKGSKDPRAIQITNKIFKNIAEDLI